MGKLVSTDTNCKYNNNSAQELLLLLILLLLYVSSPCEYGIAHTRDDIRECVCVRVRCLLKLIVSVRAHNHVLVQLNNGIERTPNHPHAPYSFAHQSRHHHTPRGNVDARWRLYC